MTHGKVKKSNRYILCSKKDKIKNSMVKMFYKDINSIMNLEWVVKALITGASLEIGLEIVNV